MKLAGLRHKERHERLWHVQLAVVIAILLQVMLNDRLSFGPKYLVAILSVFLLGLISFIIPRSHGRRLRLKRLMAMALIAFISISNIVSLGLVIHALFIGGNYVTGKELILSAMAIYITNIIVFGLWYWELDGPSTHVTDFQFPQNTNENSSQNITTKHSSKSQPWQPTFFDYLYLSVTNATAFSPTDTVPLTHRAKLLMTLQALTSLVTIALVAARAVNILS